MALSVMSLSCQLLLGGSQVSFFLFWFFWSETLPGDCRTGLCLAHGSGVLHHRLSWACLHVHGRSKSYVPSPFKNRRNPQSPWLVWAHEQKEAAASARLPTLQHCGRENAYRRMRRGLPQRAGFCTNRQARSIWAPGLCFQRLVQVQVQYRSQPGTSRKQTGSPQP